MAFRVRAGGVLVASGHLCRPYGAPVTGGSPHGRGTCSSADRSNFRKSRDAFALNLDKKRASRRTALSRLAARVGSNAAIRAAGQYRAGVMRFLLRMAFWIGVVLVLLPSAGNQPAPKSQVGAADAMSAAKAAVSDLRSFCERQADACNVGSQAAVTIGHRAQAGAKMLYEFLNEQLGPSETGTVQAPPSQHTLTPSDLEPVWRGPLPRRDPRERPA